MTQNIMLKKINFSEYVFHVYMIFKPCKNGFLRYMMNG